MKVLHLLAVTAERVLLRWQLARIHPLAPSLPSMVLRERELRDRARRIFA